MCNPGKKFLSRIAALFSLQHDLFPLSRNTPSTADRQQTEKQKPAGSEQKRTDGFSFLICPIYGNIIALTGVSQFAV